MPEITRSTVKQNLFGFIERDSVAYFRMAAQIWSVAELAYQEYESSRLQKEYLEKRGFKIIPIEGVETAFIAEYGNGSPHLGFLGEYDALPGLSQKAASPTKQSETPGGAGHGCGHNLLGTGALAAAVAVAEMMETRSLPGTIRYYGCPAEENGFGKVLMASKGVFVDEAYITWHPESVNGVKTTGSYALMSARIRFTGIAAHAGAAYLGRSALDALELTNVGVNFLREHVPTDVMMHYSILDPGGEAPNIVQSSAEGSYIVRAHHIDTVQKVIDRLKKVAQGAALMTDTEADFIVQGGLYDYIPNHALDEAAYRNLAVTPLPEYSKEETELYIALNATIDENSAREAAMLSGVSYVPNASVHKSLDEKKSYGQFTPGSSDVGDVSWIAPTTWLTAANFPLYTAAHSWQAVSASGSTAAYKAMLYAAKAMAGIAWDLLEDDGLRERARTEFLSNSVVRSYKPLISRKLLPYRYDSLQK